MQVRFLDSAAELADQAAGLLAARIEHNVAATIIEALRDRPTGAGSVFALITDGGGEPTAFAVRTPPHKLLVSVIDQPTAVALIERWLEVDPELPGIFGPHDTAWVVARAWERRTGGRVSVAYAEAMHVLERVTEPPAPASGTMRAAGRADRELVLGWWREFEDETGLMPGSEQMVDWRIEHGQIWLWEDGGPPVAVAGSSPVIAGVARIGPVYTPPSQRGRGYASSVVAALSRLALERGAERCMLYTDLANPTSNRIYASVGYRRVADWQDLEFSARG